MKKTSNSEPVTLLDLLSSHFHMLPFNALIASLRAVKLDKFSVLRLLPKAEFLESLAQFKMVFAIRTAFDSIDIFPWRAPIPTAAKRAKSAVSLGLST